MSSQQRDVDVELSRIDGNLDAFRNRIQNLQEQIDELEATLEQREERIENLEAVA